MPVKASLDDQGYETTMVVPVPTCVSALPSRKNGPEVRTTWLGPKFVVTNAR